MSNTLITMCLSQFTKVVYYIPISFVRESFNHTRTFGIVSKDLVIPSLGLNFLGIIIR